ncbi:hypothetical protein [Phascolarctobacterium sp.]|uniref:hypothetical protein n=1 Tax=Phascolarctobacterium sp. TaxID=2049039 RepID=UPI00386DC69C
MLLKVINDLCTVTNMLVELVHDLITELEHQKNVDNIEFIQPGHDGTEERTPAIEKFKERAEEAERLLDTIEYNSRRI